MSSLEAKREEFRNYLEKCGVIDGLSKALIKLYEEPNKPNDAVRFIRKYMCEECPDDEQYEKLLADFQEANTHINSLERELSSVKGNIRRTPSETELLLNQGIESLEADEECKSLLKKYLTREIFDELKLIKTSYGSTLLDCIESGLANHDSICGVYASDPEAYTVFATLFDPIIEEYHGGFTKDNVQPEFDWGDPTTFGNLDPDNEFVLSTRVRCARCIEGYGFNPAMKENQYIEIMEKLQDVLNNLEGDYKGHFQPLLEMDKKVQQQLIDDHFLFKENDCFLQAANAYRFWPVGRGVFLNEDKTFLVWCNEEDHLRIISMENTGDLGIVYNRLVVGVNLISEYLQFSRSERLGWLTFCPTNLGTTLRASVHIKLPKLSANMEQFEEIITKYNLQMRGTSGEHTESVDGVYDVSNKRRMGLTEYEAIKEMYDGITELIKIEREM